ncbi:MAG: Heme peroxidase [Rhodoferax sp.]|uniref:YqaJ viral recombinase family protein n=1 Tax=Rhodoferax sp. TaxID=50421 RepID=UPI0017B86C10|nr:YqaJ viral recombinase family protein [Rhodoferax sp.]NMM21548.1 Heme peroxidase [Rhodoferax sp.]
MKTHDLIQGSPEWLAYRLEHDNASEIAAVLGLSKTTTRTELMNAKHTGLGKEFSEWVQRNVLDYGHEVEAKVRPLVEALLGDDLYPVTCSNGRLSASLDGLTMSEEVAFECKQWNAEIAAQVDSGVMPEQHMPQCQQILMVTSAKKLIFAVGDGTPENLLTIEVLPDQTWFDRILAGWAQFHEDQAAYVPAEVVAQAVGHTPESLPALRIEVTGMVTASNLAQYKEHALAVFAGINKVLKTDQDFADADKIVKWCGDVEDRLVAAKQHALSQTESIDALFRTIDDISAEARRTRLELDKLVTARKLQVRTEIQQEGVSAMAEHIAALNARLGKPYMPPVPVDFAGAMKGKRSIDSIRDAVNTTLANAKIAASAVADRIQANLNTLRELAAAHAFLFADAAQIVLKAPDDLTMLVKSRISEHQAAEEKKAEQLRESIRKEEQDKLAKEKEDKDAADLKAAEAAALVTHEAVVEIMMPATVIKAMNPAPARVQQAQVAIENVAVEAAPNPGKQILEAMGIRVVDITSKEPATPPELKLGQMADRLGFTLTAAFLSELGFEPAATVKAAKLYHESDFPLICAALVKRINAACVLEAV